MTPGLTKHKGGQNAYFVKQKTQSKKEDGLSVCGCVFIHIVGTSP